MIASAAEGSVRDGLSILDQAIAHADLDTENKVTAARVRDMLGLADRGAQRRLLGTILEGDATALLAAIADQYSLGVEPLALMRSQMELVHRITLAQLGADLPGVVSEEEQAALSDWSERLSAGQLHRLWQLLLKGYDEVKAAPDPLVSAQMALLRLLHAADLPDPGKLAKKLETIAASPPAPAPISASAEATAPATVASDQNAGSLEFAALVAQVEDAGHALVASIMRLQVRVIECVPGKLVYARAPGFADEVGPQLREALLAATGERWQVEQRDEAGDAAPTLVEQEEASQRAAQSRIESHPMVQAARTAFPDAEIINEDEADSPRPQWSKSA